MLDKSENLLYNHSIKIQKLLWRNFKMKKIISIMLAAMLAAG